MRLGFIPASGTPSYRTPSSGTSPVPWVFFPQLHSSVGPTPAQLSSDLSPQGLRSGIWPQAAHPLCLSEHSPGTIYSGALPSCPHLNLSGKPAGFPVARASPQACGALCLCGLLEAPRATLGSPVRHLWKYNVWVMTQQEPFPKENNLAQVGSQRVELP